jgi:hypothetical protein
MNLDMNDIAAQQHRRLTLHRWGKRNYILKRRRNLAAAVTLICTCAALGLASGHESPSVGSRVFNGVSASFHVVNPTIRRGESLKALLTLKNVSSKAVAFRFTGPLVASIYVYDSRRHRLPFRNGASLGEYPAADIRLTPGEVFNTVLIGTPGDYYDLKPGKYYLRFVYDLRAISDEQLARQYMSEYKSQDVVLWDTHWYPFSVVN